MNLHSKSISYAKIELGLAAGFIDEKLGFMTEELVQLKNTILNQSLNMDTM